MTTPLLHLASASPRRKEILEALGLTFSAGGVDIDETPLAAEPAEAMVLRLAQAKAGLVDGHAPRQVQVLRSWSQA